MLKRAVVVSLAFLLSACARVMPNNPVENPRGELVPMQVGQAKLKVEIRDSEAGRNLGLSYRQNLPNNEGVLFVFPVAVSYPFWMKGMEFDLDMVWIKDGRVVGVSEAVKAPGNNHGKVETVFPPQAVDRVLEVNSGWVKEKGVQVGDEVSY
ncbi:hypothetical protein A2W24_05405 [Microgenomates group bacterium RBG_16_45_19]|nr:MAG: hypothetical protein A2W24_05405 [Microgenomates group bacterium RBG_16_45_19]